MSLHQNKKFFLVNDKRCSVSGIWDQHAFDNNFPGTPRGSRKKAIAGRSPTCRLSTAALYRGLAENGMVGARHCKCGSGRAALCKSCMSNIRPFASTPAARTKDTVIWSFNGQNCSFYNLNWINVRHFSENKADWSTLVISDQSRNCTDISARHTKNCHWKEVSSLRTKH